MSDMLEAESIERFTAGLKKVASAMRELAQLQGNNTWRNSAKEIDKIRETGQKLFSAKAMTRKQVLESIGEHEKRISKKLQAN